MAVAAFGALVLVGGRVGVAVTILAGTTSNWPTKSALGSVILFSFVISSMVLLNKAAMPPSESPDWTVYSIFVPRGRSNGMDVAVGSCISGLGRVMTCPGLTINVVGSMPVEVPSVSFTT